MAADRCPASGPRVYLAPRMLACNEDESLLKAIGQLGWSDTPSAAGASFVFNVCNPQHLKMEPGILFCRFPSMQDCCRKALYSTLLGRLRQLLPPTAPLNDGTLIPQQWSLPKQAALLREDFDARAAAARAAGEPKPVYIVKPDGGCAGTGIELTTEPCKQSPYAHTSVVQAGRRGSNSQQQQQQQQQHARACASHPLELDPRRCCSLPEAQFVLGTTPVKALGEYNSLVWDDGPECTLRRTLEVTSPAVFEARTFSRLLCPPSLPAFSDLRRPSLR